MARGNATTGRSGPRRSGLLQERSRRTRHELVRAALSLWSERGFERGVDETTVEEIAQRAGVSKGTFYFHFADKEEILLEMGLETADVLMKEAELGMRRERPVTEILESLMGSLARRIERAPRDAVLRSMLVVSRRTHDLSLRMRDVPIVPLRPASFWGTFTALARYGIQRGELPPSLDAEDFGAVLQAVTMDTILRWAQQSSASLRSMLVLHTEIILAGASSVYEARRGRRAEDR